MMLAKMLTKKSTGAQGLTFVSSATSTGSTIVIPSNAAVGDLAVLCDISTNSVGYPTLVYPTGWTAIVDDYSYFPSGTTAALSRKTLVSGDPGATITGMLGASEDSKALFVFRPNTSIGSVTDSSIASEAVNATASNQVVAANTAPYIVVGSYWSNGTTDWDTIWYTDNVYVSNMAFAYKLFNSAPSSVTVAPIDCECDRTILQSCAIVVT